ncbi:hypothetical protein VCRA2119O147_90090 [Vibrio crassostreae]|uniref:Uncharacterized protein n=1 Tax=Vibrio crassostreae TaxID=246167 RepID=A0ABM9QUL1_9VIBR|nr:hypothetical protein VCRA2118O144_110003 [Vibrio crassostreae]CAK1849461.1 hypothetical protein VCRA2116O26_10121 [Vibrio crassostreae]CAK1855616.1 hypothetical protein VCRA2113O20_10180 [Vibrio crassostreae]CAK1868284.1 hypothetical protein VCRA2119O47_10303 [Vibrio crassostreae]CAK1869609.1 hypothetical protein VCRA2119O44_10303 [Vibrio crassostreae]
MTTLTDPVQTLITKVTFYARKALVFVSKNFWLTKFTQYNETRYGAKMSYVTTHFCLFH